MKRRMSLILGIVLLAGCTTTEQGTGIGAGAGALIGGIIGHQSGEAGAGAAIGAAVGGAGGYAVGRKMQHKFCPVCGTHYDDSQQYCPKDGTQLIDRPQ